MEQGRRLLYALCGMVFLAPALLVASPRRIAVLEFSNEAKLSGFEVSALADEVREAALVLSQHEYTVMTRENMLAMLPPGADLSSCNDAACEVDAARKVGADFVVAGSIGRFSGRLLVRLKLFDTAEAALLSQRSVEAKGLASLRKKIAFESRVLFGHLASPEGKESSGSDWQFNDDTGAVLRFVSEPPGAIVEVDDDLVCETPCSRVIAKGARRIEIKKMRYETWARMLDVNENLDVVAMLELNRGWLSVSSVPNGFEVSVNGEPAGSTPVQHLEMVPGDYVVRVSGPQYREYEERCTVRRGERRTVVARLEKTLGALKLSAVDGLGNDVAGAVFIDGELIGDTPWAGRLAVGRHDVRVECGAELWAAPVYIVEREVLEVTARLASGRRPQANRAALQEAGEPMPAGPAPFVEREALERSFWALGPTFHVGISIGEGVVVLRETLARSSFSLASAVWLKLASVRLELLRVGVNVEGATTRLLKTGVVWDIVAGLYVKGLFSAAFANDVSFWGGSAGVGYGFPLRSHWILDVELEATYWPGLSSVLVDELRMGVRYAF